LRVTGNEHLARIAAQINSRVAPYCAGVSPASGLQQRRDDGRQELNKISAHKA
jgi:hypothetical protein